MCNNIRANILKKPQVKEVVKDKITDWIEDRPNLTANGRAKRNKSQGETYISYESGSPLKLHDGTRVHSIKTKKIDDEFKEVIIEIVFPNESKEHTVRIKRYADDSLDTLEEFLENSQSIFQTRNIDLNYD